MARKEVSEVEVEDTSFDVAEFSDEAPMAVSTVSRGSIVLGEISGEEEVEFKLPYISIVYGVSKIINQFDVGDIVLDKNTLIAHKNEAMKFIVLQAHPYWKEWFTPEEREIAQAEQRYERRFNTREEVAAAGGTCPLPSGGWPNGERPTFSHAMDIDILIQKPKDLVSGLFGVEIGEQAYAPARWIVDKTTFKNVGPVIAGSKRMALRNRGLSSGIFEATIKMVQGKKGTQPVPNVRLAGNLSDDELDQLKSYFA